LKTYLFFTLFIY